MTAALHDLMHKNLFFIFTLLLGISILACCSKNEPAIPDHPNEDYPTTGGVVGSGMASGIYLGVYAFNDNIYKQPIKELNDTSVKTFNTFVNNLTMKNGTLLYYSVEQALNALQTTPLPSDVSTVALVTFTDGLDQGSMMKNSSYDDDRDYLNALKDRIDNDIVLGNNITAYSIGLRGSDVTDVSMFKENLNKLASNSKYAMEVSNISEVNAKFKEIAQDLSTSSFIQSINITIPGVANGTRIRFTLDNAQEARYSKKYIEGTFNLNDRKLEDVNYVGLTSTSGSVIQGVTNGIFVSFVFKGIKNEDDILIKNENIDEYIYSNGTWQINSEFDKTENSDIVNERSSAVIMLVLDCSSSLGNQFSTAQNNAKDFINILYEAIGGNNDSENNPGNNDDNSNSNPPVDLSLAIWKDGTRHYLTQDEYNEADLSDVIVEGLTIVGGGESFILSLDDIQTNSIADTSTAKELYGSILPTKTQGEIISARWSDVNNALYSFGGTKLVGGESHSYYSSSTNYTSGNYPWGSVIFGSGGNLKTCKYAPYIRGVYSTNYSAPIVWTDPNDLKLSVIMNGKRVYLNQNEYSQNLSNIDSIEGILIIAPGEKFIISLNDAQSTSISNVSTAKQLYSDVMPTQKQGRIISARWTDVNNALYSFGGTKLVGGESHSYYTSSTSYTSGNYPWGSVIFGSGGNLKTCKYAPYIRGVISIQ